MLIKRENPMLAYHLTLPGKLPDLKEGSRGYEDYWGEIRQYCMEGYKPKGRSWIPPNLFWHYNIWNINRRGYWFDNISGNKKVDSFPLYRDVDSEIIYKNLWELRCDMNGGGIFGKRRRIGITDSIISHLHWEMSMFPSSDSFVGVPNQNAYNNIRGKFYRGHRLLPRAFSENFLVDNRDTSTLGVEKSSPTGSSAEGTLSTVHWRIFTNSGVFKGANAKFCFIDEIGEFKDNPSLSSCYNETIYCLMEGEDWVGYPVLAGTTDTENTKNTAFMEMWNNPEIYHLRKIFIPAHYVWGSKYFDMSTGKSDKEGADKAIDAEIARLKKSGDKSALFKFRQSNPKTENDMFLIIGDSRMDTVAINDLISRLNESSSGHGYGQRGNIEWVNNSNGVSGVVWVPCQDGRWYETYKPINDEYPDCEIIGVDDFMKDNAPESVSLGAICGYRRYIPNRSIVSRVPTITYLWRPPTLSEFHEDCLKTCVYRDARVGVEYINEQFRNHFAENTKVNGLKYLKSYPRVNGKVVDSNKAFGYRIGPVEKDTQVSLANEWVRSPYALDCKDAGLLSQLCFMGSSRNVDLADAFGICLLQEMDMSLKVVKDKDSVLQHNRISGTFSLSSSGLPVRRPSVVSKAAIERANRLSWVNTLNR